MSTHTPGPWALQEAADFYAINSSHKHIARMPKTSFKPFEEAENEANAALIAAAPTMLEALKLAHFALLIIPDDVKAHLPGNVLPAMQEAIRLAEGKG